MSKRKHPTATSIRQGQTIYFVSFHPACPSEPFQVARFPIVSHKEGLPALGHVIERWPTYYARMCLDEAPKSADCMYYKRGHAERGASRMNRDWERMRKGRAGQ